MSATIKGSLDLSKKFGKLKHALRGKVLADAALEGAMEEIVPEAQRLAPRATGKGAESIRAEVSAVTPVKAEVDVGWTQDHFYMLFQEFGTRFHAAQPFLRPAFDSRRRAATKTMRDHFRRRIRRVL